MIKNAQEAREIIGANFPSRYWDGKSPQVVYAIQCEAHGYLSALKGPEWIERERIMRVLVEALQHYTPRQIDLWDIRSDVGNEMDTSALGYAAKQAILAYRAAAKEIK